jgi:hypothetical protein
MGLVAIGQQNRIFDILAYVDVDCWLFVINDEYIVEQATLQPLEYAYVYTKLCTSLYIYMHTHVPFIHSYMSYASQVLIKI